MEEQMNQNQPTPSQGPSGQSPDNKDVEENKLWAFLGYLGILCLIPLLAKKDSKFAQFHAKQGLVMLIGWFFVWIPIVGWIVGLALFVFWIMGVINVFSGKMTPLPIIGDLAAKINI
jgi:uncharacterized membrane protein